MYCLYVYIFLFFVSFLSYRFFWRWNKVIYIHIRDRTLLVLASSLFPIGHLTRQIGLGKRPIREAAAATAVAGEAFALRSWSQTNGCSSAATWGRGRGIQWRSPPTRNLHPAEPLIAEEVRSLRADNRFSLASYSILLDCSIERRLDRDENRSANGWF